MTPDNEPERLTIDWAYGVDGMYHIDSFKAGFRAAEQMMKDRSPSEDEIVKASSEWDEDYTVRFHFCAGVKWLKQKLFGGE